MNTDDLQTLDLDSLQSFYDEPPEAARNVEIGLDEDRVLVRTPQARKFYSALHVANLAKTLTKLPEPGESWHIIAKGNWPAWALVPRVLELIRPRRLRHVAIATLGFSKDNADELLGMLDAGDIGGCDLIFSCYFRSNEEALTSYLTHELNRRGHRAAAIRNHAKVLAFELDDGTGLVVESSANLRSCRNVEQFCITNDATLTAFHRAWIDTLLQEGSEK